MDTNLILGHPDYHAGGKLKAIGTIYWKDPNISATNESGFTALPGGFRNANGGLGYPNSGFGGIGGGGVWWSSTEVSFMTTAGYYLDIESKLFSVYPGFSDKKFGYSVRCLKDN